MSEVENENLESVEETVETQEKQKSSKTFNQEEVNALVANRVKRERESANKQKQEFETLETEYKEQLGKYEEVLKKMVDVQAKDLPENYKKLLSKLSVLEQLEFLADEENKVSKKTIPSTPKQTEEDSKPKRKNFGTFI